MRLIDADALAKKAYEVAYPVIHGWNDHERGLTLAGIAQLLDEAPTIDVVRCRECKNWEIDWEPLSFNFDNPIHYCGEKDIFPTGDWFCKDGQRREDGDNGKHL